MATFLGSLLCIALIVIPCVAQAIPQKGEAAPPFNVNSTSGQQITLANYRGKVLLLEYFATWCAPCLVSSEHLVKLNRTFAQQGVHILGLSLDDDGDKAVREYIIAHKLNYPIALAGEAMQSDYAVRSVPTLYVISKSGIIAEKFMGYNDDIQKRIERLILKLLAE